MSSDQKTKNATQKYLPNRFSNSQRKEVNMSKKTVLRIMFVAGLLVVVLLAALMFTTQSAPAATSVESASEERLAGSDNIFLHPPVPPTAVPDNYYTGSDYCERHDCQVIP
jgi:hypothetical protein